MTALLQTAVASLRTLSPERQDAVAAELLDRYPPADERPAGSEPAPGEEPAELDADGYWRPVPPAEPDDVEAQIRYQRERRMAYSAGLLPPDEEP